MRDLTRALQDLSEDLALTYPLILARRPETVTRSTCYVLDAIAP